jgi:hypothetical protein
VNHNIPSYYYYSLIIIQYFIYTIINKNIQLLKLNILVLSLFTNIIFWNRHLHVLYWVHFGVWNGLIQFTLFQMGKFNSNVEQLVSRTVSWNGLCSKFELPLYFLTLNFILIFMFSSYFLMLLGYYN